MQHCLFSNQKSYLILFGCGGAVKTGKLKGQLINESVNQLMATAFVKQPLASPRSGNHSKGTEYFESRIANLHWLGKGMLQNPGKHLHMVPRSEIYLKLNSKNITSNLSKLQTTEYNTQKSVQDILCSAKDFFCIYFFFYCA